MGGRVRCKNIMKNRQRENKEEKKMKIMTVVFLGPNLFYHQQQVIVEKL